MQNLDSSCTRKNDVYSGCRNVSPLHDLLSWFIGYNGCILLVVHAYKIAFALPYSIPLELDISDKQRPLKQKNILEINSLVVMDNVVQTPFVRFNLLCSHLLFPPSNIDIA